MSLLPSYMNELFRAYEEMRRLDLLSIDPSLTSTDPKICHKSVLPFLAWEADVNIDGFGEDIQRSLVYGAFKALQYAGTKGAIQSALDAFTSVNVIERSNDFSLLPYNFKLDLSVNNTEITPKIRDRITKIAIKRKNVRSVLDELVLSYMQSQNVVIGGGGVGESSCSTQMIEGYEEVLNGVQKFSGGGVGETSSYAIMEV